MTKETKLERQARRFLSYEIDKFEFYDSTRWYSAQQVADMIGTPITVVQDRRRYLNQLRKAVR